MTMHTLTGVVSFAVIGLNGETVVSKLVGFNNETPKELELQFQAKAIELARDYLAALAEVARQ